MAPALEPRETRSLEHFGVGGATKWWLHPAPRDSRAPLPALPSGRHVTDGRRRSAARREEGGRWELAAAKGGRVAAAA